MGQTDTAIMLQRLPTGWSLYDGGEVLARFGEEESHLERVTLQRKAVMAANLGLGYWRQTRWKDGACTQYVWVSNA